MKFLKIICFVILINVTISSAFAAPTGEICCSPDCGGDTTIAKMEKAVKDKLKTSFKAGIKPIKEDVADISCLEDIWADITKLYGKVSNWKMPDLSKPEMGDFEFDMDGFWDKAMNKAKEKACELMQDSVDSIAKTVNDASKGLSDAAKNKIKGAVADARKGAKKAMKDAAKPVSDPLKDLAKLSDGKSTINDQKKIAKKHLRKIENEYNDVLY